jgi:hypothetical protein
VASPIRVDEWQAALEVLASRSADGFTSKELAEATGLSLTTTRIKIGQLLRSGRARLSGHRMGHSIAGRIVYIPVYQLVQEGK